MLPSRLSPQPPSSGLTPSATHKILNSTLLFTSLLAFQTRLYKSTCRILSTDLPTLDPAQLTALFDTIDRVRRSLGPTAAALKKEGGASQEAKDCLQVVEELRQTIMFDGGLVKLVKEGVGLLGLSSDGSWVSARHGRDEVVALDADVPFYRCMDSRGSTARLSLSEDASRGT